LTEGRCRRLNDVEPLRARQPVRSRGTDWGDVPMWAQAVATFLALGAAIVAGIVEAKVSNLERRMSEQRDDEKRPERASPHRGLVGTATPRLD
jgi:hypothetical protein